MVIACQFHIHSRILELLSLYLLDNFPCFVSSAECFFQNQLFLNIHQEYYQSVKQLGSRSSPTFCRS